MLKRFAWILGASLTVAFLAPATGYSQSPATVPLGSAAAFELLAGSTITNVGNSIINGDIGVSPSTGNVIVGFPPGIVNGGKYIGVGPASVAQSDLTTAYNDAAGRTANAITRNGDLGGLTLVPGLYVASTSLGLTGNVTLDAQGNANAVWIFQIGSTLTTASSSQVVLINGAQAKNIFWQVGSSATLGSGSIFYGNILAQASISINSSATMVGRALARTGAVTSAGAMNGTNPDLLVANAPIFTTPSRNIDMGSTHVDSAKWKIITISNTGTADLTITTATSSNIAFTAHLSGTLVTPGSTVYDTIKFLPKTTGADSGKLIFTSNAASSPDTIVVRGNGSGAILFTTSRRVDLGSTQVGIPTSTLVTLTNTGNDTLRITAATSTNPAFSSQLSGLTIAPGASIIDLIKFLPVTMGADSGKLYFTSNALRSPDTIAVRGIGKAAILATSSRNVNVGSTRIGTTTWTLITLTNMGNDTLRFNTETSSNYDFSSHLSGSLIAPGASVIDSIKFLPTKMGLDAGTLLFSSNAITTPDSIAVIGNGTAAVLVSNSRNVDCGTTLIGTPTWTLITLANSGNETLHITSSTSTNAVFSSHLSGLSIEPGAWVSDTIKFLPTVAGAAAGKLIFTGNSLTAPDTIAVYGNGTLPVVVVPKTAILSTSSRNVDCGTTPLGTPTWTLVTLSNTGTDTLRISSSTSSNLVFSSRLSDVVIAPGASVIDLLVFLPTVKGMNTGRLTFTSNATSSPDTIGVHGVGTTPVGVNEGASPVLYTLGEMYPNPVSDATQLHVRLQSGEQLVRASMYNMLGRELQDWTSRVTSDGLLTLHLGSYPVGQYVVRLLTTSRMQILPVVVAK